MNRSIALVLVLFLSFESFGAIVGDNDGNAFVTKEEFEDLKTEFNKQIDNYNTSLESKIDGAISNYLAGIKVMTTKTVSTAFDLEGKKNKQINFLGRTNNGLDLDNEIYARDKIDCYANGAYSSGTSAYEHDTYDNWIWYGQYERGNANNVLFLLDKNNCVSNLYYNIKMYCNRFYGFYSTKNAQDGITWIDVYLEFEHPTQLVSTDNSYINSTKSKAQGMGHSRVAQGSTHATYTVYLDDKFVYTTGNASDGAGTRTQTTYTSTTVPQCVLTPVEEKPQIVLQQNCAISMSKNEYTDYGIHFCYNPNKYVRTSNAEWSNIAIVDKATTSVITYTIPDSSVYQYASGYWATAHLHYESLIKREIKGYGVRFKENLTISGTPKLKLSDIYYQNLYKKWGDKEKLKYTGGMPLYKAESPGYLTFRIKKTSTAATNLVLTNKQKESMPAASNIDALDFDYKLSTSSVWTEGVRTMSLASGTSNEYDIRVDLLKNDIVYLNIDTSEGTVSIRQTDDALWTSVN